MPSIATRSTTEDAIGFGRTGERKAKLPVVCPRAPRGLQHDVATRAMHPVQDLKTPMTVNIRERRAPALIHHDRADWPVRGLPHFGQSPRACQGVWMVPMK